MTSLRSRRGAWPDFLLVAALLLVMGNALVSATDIEEDVISRTFRLERRLGVDGTWKEIASFSLSRSSPTLPPRLRTLNAPRKSLSEDERKLFGTTDLLFYRAVDEDSKPGDFAPMLTVSPCSIIRGFTPVDKTTLLLREVLRVVPSSSLDVMGLQVSSYTNSFHSKMVNGDACDATVVTKLFSQVEVEAELSLVSQLSVRPVKYEELKSLMDPHKEDPQKSKKTQGRRAVKGGEEDAEEPPAAEPSFFAKYWFIFLIPFVLSMVKNAQ